MYLPIDIIRRILLKLKVEALIRCQSICKEWHSTIQHPNFKLSYRGERRVLAVASGRIKTLFPAIEGSENRSFLDTIPARQNRWWSGVWCSCNGLVLFSVGKHILLWNPSTRCCTKVLELRRLNSTIPEDIVSGLCYVPSTGDYKAVLVFRFGRNRTAIVSSLKSKEWRKVPFPYNSYSARGGVNFHNTLHWAVNDSVVRTSAWRPDKIIYFEAESDEFKELSTPNPELHGEGETDSAFLGLGIMDGCICMAGKGKERGEIQVLVMKEYGVKKSWVSQFVISTKLFGFGISATTLYSSKCNTKVLICSDYYGSWETLVYDVKNNKLDNYFLKESEHHDDAICSYVESIVSPHEFIWRDDQHKPLRFILERLNI